MATRVTVLGSGAWGTTLAKVLAEAGHEVLLWCRRPEVAAEVNSLKSNSALLPGVPLPEQLQATSSLSDALYGAEAVLIAVPARGLREAIRAAKPFWPENATCLTTSKGLEPETHLRMSQVIAAELDIPSWRIAALSGPNHAPEIARRSLASAVVAAENREVAVFYQRLLMAPYYRLYINPDIIGVELGGALKNVIAIAAGICDGLGLGDNTKAALVTRGLAEMIRLGRALGAEAQTFSGLSGIGDLFVTCTSKMSRNRHCGEQIGQGKSFEQVEAESRAVIEGARTSIAVHEMAGRFGLDLPISETVFDILYGNHPVEDAIDRLMNRIAKPEDESQALKAWAK